jgi:2,3-bisphosphoglycerate-independent phosphoglycerate mutase
MKAIIKALEYLDKCLERIVMKIVAKEGIAVIAADHGNCEQKLGKTKTSHTTNKVNFILIGKEAKVRDGKLCDIAPTILELLKMPKPKEMTGKSLII